MFKIGEFSKLSNISVRSLRHYESLGLLLPRKTDPVSVFHAPKVNPSNRSINGTNPQNGGKSDRKSEFSSLPNS
jgi:hypothetical protein